MVAENLSAALFAVLQVNSGALKNDGHDLGGNFDRVIGDLEEWLAAIR